jgi:hypothetical protein
MASDISAAPTPDLRIVLTGAVLPHEDHDSQRALPLIERLKHEEFIINPPIVAPMNSNQYVILDGANRCFAFQQLGYPHILVQVATYEGGYVELRTWSHIVSSWNPQRFTDHLASLADIEIIEYENADAIARILLRDGRVLSLMASVQNTHERNAVLRQVVSVYQQNARLHRTTLSDPDQIWPLYKQAIALVVFPSYQPADIIAAAHYRAYLPPGVSRHIVHGRALRVNYPISALRDENTRLPDKNQRLKSWLRDQLENRRIRYYAEATYQFGE